MNQVYRKSAYDIAAKWCSKNMYSWSEWTIEELANLIELDRQDLALDHENEVFALKEKIEQLEEKLNSVKLYKIYNAIENWLEIRNKETGYGNFSAVDAQHSALLNRLVDGKEPFDRPPPKSMSYPNYTIMENGIDYPSDVHEYVTDPGRIYIDQYSWKIVSKTSPENMIVRYDDSGVLYKLYKDVHCRPVWDFDEETKKWVPNKIDSWVLEEIKETKDGSTSPVKT